MKNKGLGKREARVREGGCETPNELECVASVCVFVVGSKIVCWFACVGEPETPKG